MTKYYDKTNKRLVYTGQASNSLFWDKHWDKNTIEKILLFDYVVNTTKKSTVVRKKERLTMMQKNVLFSAKENHNPKGFTGKMIKIINSKK